MLKKKESERQVKPLTDKSEKQELKEEKKRDRKVKKKISPLLVGEIVPVIGFDEDIKAGIMEDGTFIDFLQINTKDLQSASDDDTNFEEMCWEKLYKIYGGDLKIISFNFPVDTKKQQSYIERKYDDTENPIFKEFLEVYNAQLMWISENRLDREHILVFFSKDIEEHRDNHISIMSTLSGLKHPLVSKMGVEKKRDIIFKLMNKNTLM